MSELKGYNSPGGYKEGLLPDAPSRGPSKQSSKRLTVATSDARMAQQAIQIRNRRASVQKADMRNKRASVATSDARLMEARRCEQVEEEFLSMVAQNRKIEQGMARTFNMKQLRRAARRASVMGGPPTAEDEADDDGEGQSNTEAVLNMLNTALGTGILALASVIMKVGIIPGFGIMVLSAVINCYSCLVHIKTCRLASCDAAGATLGEVSCGRVGLYSMTFAYVILCFMSMVGYVDVSAESMKTVISPMIPSVETMDEMHFKILNWAIFLLPGTFIRDLGGVAIMSLISLVGALLVLATILSHCGVHLITHGLPPMDKINLWPESFAHLLSAVPVLVACYAMQTGGCLIISNLKDNSPKNQTKVCILSFTLMFCMEITVAMLGYLYFLDETPSQILTAFPDGDTIANFGRLGTLFLVICGYVMLNVPSRIMIIQMVFQKNETKKETSYVQFFLTNLAISVSAVLVGLVISDLSLVIQICGSVAVPFISFMFPAFFTMMVRAKSDDPEVETPLLSSKQMDMFLLLGFGAACWLIFNFGLVLDMVGLTITDDFHIVSS